MGSLPAVRSESGLVPGNVSELLEMAAIAVKSGLLPRGVDTKEKAALIMLKGHELGITTMQSFESLFVVYGRVGMDTKLMATLLRRAGHDYRVIERTPERAVVDLYLKQDRTVDGWPARRFVLTMEEAKAARWHMEKNTRTGQASYPGIRSPSRSRRPRPRPSPPLGRETRRKRRSLCRRPRTISG